MRKIIFALAASMLLSQCSAPPATPEMPPKPVTLQSIEGQWDIVSFDGHRPARLGSDGQRHAFVDIRGSDLSFAIECNYSGMSARLDEDRLVVIPSDDVHVQTEMGCGPEREARDEAFFGLLRGGPTVSQPSANELVLEKDGARLELQRPDLRRRDLLATNLTALQGDWIADILYWRSEPGRTDNLIAELEGGAARVTFAPGQIRLSVDCETVTAQVALSAPGELRARDVTRTQAGACRLSQAHRDKGASLLTGAIGAENIPPDRLYLAAGDVYAVLRRD